MNFNIYNSLILVGIVQGVIFGGIWLFSKKYRAKSTYFLVALILVYSLSNLQYYLLDTGIISRVQFYSYLSFPWPLLMPALVLFYGLTFLNPNKKISRVEKLLYLPFFIVLVLGFIYKANLLFLDKDLNFSPFFEVLHIYTEFAGMLFGLIVLAFLFLKIIRFEKQQSFSPKKLLLKLNWLKATLLLLFLTTLLWAYLESTYVYGTDNSYFYPLWIVIAIIIYWLGHIGIYKFGIREERKKIRKKVFETGPRITEVLGKNEHLITLENYLVEKRNFMNPRLSLEKIASELSISKGHLSRVINSEMNMSFKDYLNKLRVDEAKNYLTDPSFSNYTLVAIGLEAGFNSKSAFNASFKKVTGITPSEFKRKHSNESYKTTYVNK